MSVDHHSAPRSLQLTPASEADFKALLAWRMAAIREGLERAGPFDSHPAREHLSRGHLPACTRPIQQSGERVGFVVVPPRDTMAQSPDCMQHTPA